MVSSYLMSSDRAFGLLLFSGAIVLTVSKQTGIFSKLSWIRSAYTQNERDGPSGDFIIRKNKRSSNWKSFYSSPDAEESDMRCEIELKNDTGDMLVFCWIMPSGKLRNFSPIHDGSIRDNSVPNSHLEYAQIYHAFLCMTKSKRNPKTLSEVSDEDFIFVYRPTLADFRHKITLSKCRTNRYKAHVVCKRIKEKSSTFEVVDSTKKLYVPLDVCGFTCHTEPGVFEKTSGLLEALTADLEMMRCLLPNKAFKTLQKSTPLWINIKMKYGPIDSPIDDSMCFHPTDGHDWLTSMGMRTDKAGGVEIYCAKNYLETRGHWGVGGVILHEYSHAYHYKHCENGFENDDIKQAYEEAMEKKLYDCVPVHGPQGLKGGCKAYACYNCMEFFAELSVAFHWQRDCVDSCAPYSCEIEHNKWYPHNYAQLKKHDIKACRMLAKMWGVDMNSIPDGCSIQNGSKVHSVPTASSGHSPIRSSEFDKLGPMLDKLKAYTNEMTTP